MAGNAKCRWRLDARIIRALCLLLAPSWVAAHSVDGVPALRVRAPNGASSVMVGSMHTAYPGLAQPTSSILREAKRLVVEHDPTPDPGGIAPEVANGQHYANWALTLTEQEVVRFREHYACLVPKSPPAAADTFLTLQGPWFAAAVAWVPCPTQWQPSRDDLMAKAAKSFGVPVAYLESREDIVRRRASVPPSFYVRQLRNGLDPETVKRDFGKAVAALNHGDYETVASIGVGRVEEQADAAVFQRVMVQERNQAWLPALMAYLNEGHSVVLVGAAHLPGHDGLISLLRLAGYSIEPIMLPAGPTS